VAYASDSFTGDGTTTVFTLSNTPITNSLYPFVNGQLQSYGVSNDYTTSGVTVTFTTAGEPGNGARIIANYTVAVSLPPEGAFRVCNIVVGDTSSGSAITDAQLGPQKDICFIEAAASLKEGLVSADAGTPNVIVRRRRVE
jgi:hypothetical protein